MLCQFACEDSLPRGHRASLKIPFSTLKEPGFEEIVGDLLEGLVIRSYKVIVSEQVPFSLTTSK